MTMPEFNEKQIEEIAMEVVKKYNKSSAFTDRKVTDTPSDALSVVPRKFVTANGTFTNRPKAVTGQMYLATDLATNGLPAWYNGTNWVSATGSILGVGI